MKHAAISAIFGATLVVFAAAVVSGPHEDAVSAYQRGDYAQALLLFRPLADKGDAEAEDYIGRMYARGQGVHEDRAAGFNWIRKAAEQGNAMAQYDLGIAYVDGKDTKQDDTLAVAWFRKAASQGNSDAQFWLGLSYEQAAGVPQDYAASVSWYRKSANQGNGLGQYALGLMYYKGHGVAQDLTQAHQWFNLSAARDSDLRRDAEQMRDRAAAQMTPAQLSEAQKLAREWKPRATEKAPAAGSEQRGK